MPSKDDLNLRKCEDEYERKEKDEKDNAVSKKDGLETRESQERPSKKAREK